MDVKCLPVEELRVEENLALATNSILNKLLAIRNRIKNSKEFNSVFLNGKTIVSDDRRLKASVLISKNEVNPGIRYAVAVSKKSGIAVWRNRTKRLIRDSYRMIKDDFISDFVNKKILVNVIFTPYQLNQQNSKKLRLADLLPAMENVFTKIVNRI